MTSQIPDMDRVNASIAEIDGVLSKAASSASRAGTYGLTASIFAANAPARPIRISQVERLSQLRSDLVEACTGGDKAKVCRILTAMAPIITALFAPPVAIALTGAMAVIGQEFLCSRFSTPVK